MLIVMEADNEGSDVASVWQTYQPSFLSASIDSVHVQSRFVFMSSHND